MAAERLDAAGDPRAAAARVRALVPGGASVADAVAEIVAAVAEGGDAAVLDLGERFDGLRPAGGLRVPGVPPDALSAPLEAALDLAIVNVGAVARAGLDEEREVALGQGQRVRLREVPVRRAAVYVPGGRAPYPSTVVMGAVTARAAGVEQVVVCSPPEVDPAILGACALCEVDEVYAMGGAQAIAALALGTESVEAVDVIVGPGNLYVQEAKRQLADRVGIDGFAGPSDLLVLLDGDAPLELAALDLLAQAEHGAGSLVVGCSPDGAVLDALAERLGDVAPAAAALVQVGAAEEALAFANAFAAEHLQLMGPAMEALAPGVRSAGCLFVGPGAGTAFGDYLVGSNHVLPTGGAARFASGLNVRHFRRRMAEVHAGPAAAALAPPGATIARAEGFGAHAASMEARIRENASR